MVSQRLKLLVRVLPGLLLALAAIANAQKKPIQLADFDQWKSIRGNELSRDGKWALYAITPEEGDGVLEVRSLTGDTKYTIDRGLGGHFSKDGRFAIAIVQPKFADTQKAKKDKVKPEDQPKNTLVILNLENGQQTAIERVASFQLPKDDIGWFVYKPEPPKVEKKPDDTKKPEEKKTEEKKAGKKPDDKPGSAIVLRNLPSGKEERIENVTSWTFPKDGSVLAYALSTKDGSGDGIVYEDLVSGKSRTVVKTMGRYPKIAIQNTDKKLAYLTDKDDYAAKIPSLSLFLYDPKTDKSALIAKEGGDGVPKGWVLSENNLSWSDRGSRIEFGTRPKPPEEKKDDTLEEDKVSVDVWSWTDPLMMPQQLLQAERERSRSYDAVYNLDSQTVVQLATLNMPGVTISDKGDGAVAIGESSLPYEKLISWDTDYRDIYIVDPRTGQAKQVVTKTPSSPSVSPSGKYIAFYDPATTKYTCVDTLSGASKTLGNGVNYPLYNELEDTPGGPGPYGIAGWSKDDSRLFVYDGFDIWTLDPTGKAPDTRITGGFGRNHNIRFRVERLDRDKDYVSPEDGLLLDAFDPETKAAGFYWLAPNTLPSKLIWADKSFSFLEKAKDSDRILFTQEDFNEFRDLWTADLKFESPQKLTNANPQQSQYNWCTAELVSWISNDGVKLQGLLYKPEDFTYAKKYPMIAYYYERDSDTFHRYLTPAPSASVINPAVYASNGYVVFVPDIAYRVGYPGESALSAIVPGVLSILNHGYVDPKRLGIQGQSWGGYETGYLVTQTNLFAAACAGAPVSDMVSAYGGIRWGSGVVRSMQYEKGQSRIGGSLWEKPLQFLENSPIFWVDKVETPLLMMNNDKDGAVPWYQGIEYFSALRRLNKPCWLIVYNGEDHNLVQRKNRKDWTRRMQQFFDHYLKGGPMPEWMAHGVPATMKGKDYGFEYVKNGGN